MRVRAAVQHAEAAVGGRLRWPDFGQGSGPGCGRELRSDRGRRSDLVQSALANGLPDDRETSRVDQR